MYPTHPTRSQNKDNREYYHAGKLHPLKFNRAGAEFVYVESKNCSAETDCSYKIGGDKAFQSIHALFVVIALIEKQITDYEKIKNLDYMVDFINDTFDTLIEKLNKKDY